MHPIPKPDDEAFLDLVRRFDRRVFQIARWITQNDAAAERVLINTFLKAMSRPHDFEDDAKVRAWLATIAVNEALLFAITPEPLSHPLDRAMRILEPLDRAVFVLKDVEAMSIDDIAQSLNLPVRLVKRRVLRARLGLREELTDKVEADCHPPVIHL